MMLQVDDHDEARITHLRASVQELRRVTAIATAWLTPGDYPPCEVDPKGSGPFGF